MLVAVDREVFLPLIIWSFAVGILFGAVYDIFRIRRVAFRIPGLFSKRGSISSGASFFDTALVFLEDILFSLFCTAVFILVGFKLHFGIPRWYSAASALGGFWLYRITAGRLFMSFSEAMLRFTVSAVIFVYRHTVLALFGAVKKRLGIFLGILKAKRRARITEKYEASVIASLTIPSAESK